MRRVQRNCLEDLCRAYPNATNKELLKGVLVSRLKTTAQLNMSIYNFSEKEINEVMVGINTLDDLVKYIAELEAQEPHPPDPLPSVGNLINAILDEDFCSPLESSRVKETTPYIKKQTEKPVETKSCPYCGNSIAVDVLKCPDCGKYAQKCVNHPRRQAINTCVECGQFLCRECSCEGEGETYCPECFSKLPEDSQSLQSTDIQGNNARTSNKTLPIVLICCALTINFTYHLAENIMHPLFYTWYEFLGGFLGVLAISAGPAAIIAFLITMGKELKRKYLLAFSITFLVIAVVIVTLAMVGLFYNPPG